jgi:hypothetical protein
MSTSNPHPVAEPAVVGLWEGHDEGTCCLSRPAHRDAAGCNARTHSETNCRIINSALTDESTGRYLRGEVVHEVGRLAEGPQKRLLHRLNKHC